MCIAIVCLPDCDAINFEIKLPSNQAVFSAWSNSQGEHLNILRTKRGFKTK